MAMTTENFVPTWCVPLAAVKTKKPQFVLKMQNVKIPFVYTYNVGCKHKSANVELDVHRLVLADQTGGTVFESEERLPVVRQAEGDLFHTKATLPPLKESPPGVVPRAGPDFASKTNKAVAHMFR